MAPTTWLVLTSLSRNGTVFNAGAAAIQPTPMKHVIATAAMSRFAMVVLTGAATASNRSVETAIKFAVDVPNRFVSHALLHAPIAMSNSAQTV